MTVLIGRNTKVEIEKSVGADITLTDVAKTNQLGSPTGQQVHAPAHGLLEGAYGYFTIEGMKQLDGQIARAIHVTTNYFDIDGIDTTNYSDFSSGTFTPIATWTTLAVARTVSAGSVSANRLDATTLLDDEKQYVLGMSDTPEITIDMLSAPLAEAVEILEAAGRSSVNLSFRVTMNDESIRIFRGQVTIPSESISVNELVTGQISVTQTRRRLAYAS